MHQHLKHSRTLLATLQILGHHLSWKAFEWHHPASLIWSNLEWPFSLFVPKLYKFMMISLLVLIPFDQTDKTFIRPLWCKKSSPYCGENLGGVKRHLWNAGGGGGGRLRSRSGGFSTRPPDCPHLDRKCAGFWIPGSSVWFVPPALIIWAEVDYRPLFASTVISNVPTSQSWICTLSERNWCEPRCCCQKEGDERKVFLQKVSGASEWFKAW